MKLYLILAVLVCGALAASAAVRAPGPATQEAPQVVQHRGVVPVNAAKAPAQPRRLSVEERAELRRQLYQFDQSAHGKKK